MLSGALYLWIFLACGKTLYLPASYMQSSGKLPNQQLWGGLHLWDELLMSLQVNEVHHTSSACSLISLAEQFYFASSFIACTPDLKWIYLILTASSTPANSLEPLRLQPIKMNSTAQKREYHWIIKQIPPREAELLGKMRKSCNGEEKGWKLWRGYSYNPSCFGTKNIFRILKFKTENKKWPKMYCEQKKKIDIKHTKSLKVLKRNIL